jgi:hypothetical protein
MNFNSICPKCNRNHGFVFPESCSCGFNLTGLIGLGTSSFQVEKFKQHTDLLYGTDINLYGKDLNCSFTTTGFSDLFMITRFALTFGERAELPSRSGRFHNDVVVCYIPEIIGYGTTPTFGTSIPVSGCCLISPASETYAHSFPAFNIWIGSSFDSKTSNCRSCGNNVPFAEPFCSSCLPKYRPDWRSMF